MVVVMVGTAVTVEAISAEGVFLGGLILPGHGIMLRALESGTAGLRVPTGEVREFPTNTSDALTSGGTFAIAGAVERMVQHVRVHCHAEPLCYMTGGAGWKMAPSMSVSCELIDSLIFDGLREIAAQRLAAVAAS
jgi:type III pantothenate kinase